MHTLEQLRSGALTGVKRLDLSCGLTRLPEEIFDLADSLEVLNLSGNQLTELPAEIARLRKLKIIFASNNLFTHLPESLGECESLEVVGFKATRIGHVPAASLPPKLRWLILTDNAIAQLPDAVGERPLMQKLMLAGNRLKALPEGLRDADRLELLRISANDFSGLPPWLVRLPRLAWLALSGNPLGWDNAPASLLPKVQWNQIQVGEMLGEGASGHIFQAREKQALEGPWKAMKLFKGAVTSDGLPEHEIAGSLTAGPHQALCTPVAEVTGHPQETRGILLPLIPPTHQVLAGPPSLDSCTRDVYPAGFGLKAETALALAQKIAGGLAHMHARGVMHGDFYAHNILWNPVNGDGVLSDMGAATPLPEGQPVLRKQLLSLEVRAVGYWLDELAAHLQPEPARSVGETAAQRGRLQAAAAACLHLDPAARPDLTEVVECLKV